MEYSFGEQMKMLLKRKNMTIQDLADLYTEKTGVTMSRQNLTQRLKRDNFPEQDMRTFASLLGYEISIELSPADSIPEVIRKEKPVKKITKKEAPLEALPVIEEIPVVEEIPFTEHISISEEVKEAPVTDEAPVIEEFQIRKENESTSFSDLFKKTNSSTTRQNSSITFHIPDFFRKNKEKTAHHTATNKERQNTGNKENYATNTVRKHPTMEDYVQVYEQETGTWSDVKEDEFWKFQEKKKQMLGKDYQPPIIL